MNWCSGLLSKTRIAFLLLTLFGCCLIIYTSFEGKMYILLASAKNTHFIHQNENIQYIKSNPENSTVIMFNNNDYKERKNKGNGICPELGIYHKYQLMEENLTCMEHKPFQSGCKFAKENYVYDIKKRTCNTDPRITICHFQQNVLRCSYRKCGRHFNGNIMVQLFDPTSGVVKTVQKRKFNRKSLAKAVMKYARITVRRGYNFMFISCGGNETHTQLLLLDQIIMQEQKKLTRGFKNRHGKININVVMIDSVSQAHFFRSLKKTVRTFDETNSDTQTNAEVLDFQLFQALHGHSPENAHALFTGNVFPLNYTTDMKSAVGTEKFYRYLKSMDYETLYQEDMCWKAIWGIRTDLGGASNWKVLREKIAKAKMDDTGLTFASCKIMKRYDETMIFNLGKHHKVCYNGHQMDTYYLEYLYKRFSSFLGHSNRQNIFAYSALMVSHDAGGLRIQTIDEDLARFSKSMSQLDNTLTVILADHGNSYTTFPYSELEGQYEMFHPALFMIIPSGVQKYLGDETMRSLRLNQLRMITMIDLHKGFKSLTSRTAHKGFLKPISAKRYCSDVPLRHPNLCICEGWDHPGKNTTKYVGHLELAVGELNNIIMKASPNGDCKRLVPTMFDKVIARNEGMFIDLSFYIYTAPGYGSTNKYEQFVVHLKYKASVITKDHDHKMTLHRWDRISTFGGYRSCSDADFRFRLCVCDEKRKGRILENVNSQFLQKRTSKSYEIFDRIGKEEFKHVIENKLIVIKRTYNEIKYGKDAKEIDPYLISVTFEVANLAVKHKYSVTIVINNVSDMKPLVSGNCSSVIQPNSVLYLCTLVRSRRMLQASFNYSVDYKIIN